MHVFLNFPPRYSIANVEGILKSFSASQMFREYPELKKHMRKQEFERGMGILFGRWGMR